MDIQMFFSNAISNPIPRPDPRILDSWAEWNKQPIVECGEPLVPIGHFLSPHTHEAGENFFAGKADVGFSDRIYTNSIYAKQAKDSPYENPLEGSLLTPFVREGNAKRLVKAAAKLPRGYAFIVWDSYRTLATQKALYDDYHGQLMTKKGMSHEEATKAAKIFVSIPSSDPTKPSPHNTGASIDLSIVRFDDAVLDELDVHNRMLRSKDADVRFVAETERMRLLNTSSTLLNMGTPFDSVQPETATYFYEDKLGSGSFTKQDQECLQNRRLLCRVMNAAGFSVYHEEWWHFDAGNQFHAYRTGKPAIYGSATFSPQCAQWEKKIAGFHAGMYHWLNHEPPMTKLGQVPEIYQMVVAAARRAGNLGRNGFPMAKKLEA